MNKNNILIGYLQCAVFADAPDEFSGEQVSVNSENFTPESIETSKSDIEQFVQSNKKLLEESCIDDYQIGHDFWLTRNGHGVGFWDRNIGEAGDQIADAINSNFKEVNLERLVDGTYQLS